VEDLKKTIDFLTKMIMCCNGVTIGDTMIPYRRVGFAQTKFIDKLAEAFSLNPMEREVITIAGQWASVNDLKRAIGLVHMLIKHLLAKESRDAQS